MDKSVKKLRIFYTFTSLMYSLYVFKLYIYIRFFCCCCLSVSCKLQFVTNEAFIRWSISSESDLATRKWIFVSLFSFICYPQCSIGKIIVTNNIETAYKNNQA